MKSKHTAVIGMGLIVVILIIFKFAQRQPELQRLQGSPTVGPTPTPFPFQEMTIPYLRSRTYQSRLGEKTRAFDRTSYTAYTTSYLSDGLTIHGLLTIPKTERPQSGFPAVVFIHGYIPPQQYRTTVNYVDYVDFLARNGIVVFKIDLRGHDQSEGEPGGAYYSSDYIIDTLHAYNALESLAEVDPKRIGLWGHSMAGNIVFRSVAAKPTIPTAVIWAGAVYTYEDMAKYRISDGSYQPPPSTSDRQRKRQQLREIHGNFSTDSEFWQQVAPTNYLKEITTAIQIHHATNDNVVSIAYSRDLMQLLDTTSIVHQLYEYPTGGHNITGAAFTQAMQRTVEFFK